MKHMSRPNRPSSAKRSTQGLPGSPKLQSSKQMEATRKAPPLGPTHMVLVSTCSKLKDAILDSQIGIFKGWWSLGSKPDFLLR